MNKEAGKWQANLVAGEKSKRGGRMSLGLGEALKVGVFMQCCGFDLGKGWFCFELCSPDGDDPDRCPKPATFTYDNGTERIPLCAEHYDAWRADEAEPGDGTSPVWFSQEWLEKYEDCSALHKLDTR